MGCMKLKRQRDIKKHRIIDTTYSPQVPGAAVPFPRVRAIPQPDGSKRLIYFREPENKNSMYQWALSHIEFGLKIFPLKPGTDAPIDGINWKQEASNDPEQIRRWWINSDGSENRYNVGVACWIQPAPNLSGGA